MIDRLVWKVRRLQVMSVPEVAWRIVKQAQAIAESCGLGLAKRIPMPHGAAGRAALHGRVGATDPTSYIAAAERILEGRFDVFAARDLPLGFPPPWNRDPRSGTEAPMRFGKFLNYRNESLVGDVKYLWEPNRHLQLVTLAQAYAVSGEERYAKGCQRLLESWIRQCPYPLGPQWTSSLEHAVRLVNWSLAWQLLGGDSSSLFVREEGQRFRTSWLEAIFRHCHFIAGHLSKFSSANNHLFGEYMGLFIGATVWPMWQASTSWQAVAKRGIETEALRQNAEDGVNREQAFWYHHAVADMMLLCGLTGRANGIEFSAQFWTRLERMIEFIFAVMDTGGCVPLVGDADDGVMVRLSPDVNFDVFRSLLATGAVLFARPDFKAKARAFDEKSGWLLGTHGQAAFDALPRLNSIKEPRRAFPHGGYWVLGDRFDTSEEVRAIADAGPLGYLSIAAHGHADALALALSAGGHELLIDPGTFAYHTQQEWRDYFRGTAAHNTVRVDRLDQSVIGGKFLWLTHAEATCEVWDSSADRDHWVARHHGYCRLDDPVIHRREIVYDKQDRTFVVRDVLECAASHFVEIAWHCHENAHVSLDNGHATVSRENVCLKLAMSAKGFTPRIARGEENPPLGWVSRRFDSKVPTHVVVWSGHIKGTCTLESHLRLHFSSQGKAA